MKEQITPVYLSVCLSRRQFLCVATVFHVGFCRYDKIRLALINKLADF